MLTFSNTSWFELRVSSACMQNHSLSCPQVLSIFEPGWGIGGIKWELDNTALDFFQSQTKQHFLPCISSESSCPTGGVWWPDPHAALEILFLLQRLNANFVHVPCVVEGLLMSMKVRGTYGTTAYLSEGSIAINGSTLPQKVQKGKSLAGCHCRICCHGPRTASDTAGPEVTSQMIF